MITLDEIINSYAYNKIELDSYKKLCESQNESIKEQMRELNESSHRAGDYVAKISVQHKETFDEDKLLALLERCSFVGNDGNPITAESIGLIKTKPYVDINCLEEMIYNGTISDEILLKLDACKIVKEVKTLRVTKYKEKKSKEEE